MKFSHHQIVAVNDPVELTCNVSGISLISSINSTVVRSLLVRWVHNGVDVVMSSANRVYFPQSNVMRINQATVSDSGVYQCFVETGANNQQGLLVADAGDVQDSTQLSVRDSPPRLTSVFNEQSIHPGRAGN